MGSVVAIVLLVVVVVLIVAAVSRSVRIVPQASAGIVERFGRYHRTLPAGLNMVTPFVDRLRPLIDLREQVVSFPPQPVITEDNLVVAIDTVIYFQVTDARAATYEVANYIQAVEQLTVTTLRNVVGGMDLETALTSRDQINSKLRAELDEATGKWGIRVGRVEIKAIEPPASIQDSMEKQMRADRDKRAAILSAEGSKQSAILTAEGQRQAAVLRARGESEAAVLLAEADAKAQAARAKGQAEAIGTVFQAIHDGNPDQRLLAYQYMQMLPQIAQGDANKVWIVPSEIGKALEGLGGFLGGANNGRAADQPASSAFSGPAAFSAPSGPPAYSAPAAFSGASGSSDPSGPGAPAIPGAPSGPDALPGPDVPSGARPELDPAGVSHAGLEGWLTRGGGAVHDGAVGDHEGGAVPRAGDAGAAPLNDDPTLMEGPAEVRAPV
jgi:regulator of protease activity HflC (stomatin/prohibitin superfamily)